MKKWNLIVDVAECHNCHNCFIACKDEYVGNTIEGYSAAQPLHGHRWIDIKAKERGQHPRMETTYVPTMCNHCDDAPCIKASDGAITKRADGIVLISPEKAKGRKDLVKSCPYGAIWWNDDLDVPQSWPFDAHLLDRGWSEPRCVQSCPTGALKSLKVEDAEMAEIAKSEGLQPISSKYKTKPRVHYKNLYQYNTLFIAGDVLEVAGEAVECLGDVQVILHKDDQELGRALTNPFGEFTIDGLEPELGECTLTVSKQGFETIKVALMLERECVVVETLKIAPQMAEN